MHLPLTPLSTCYGYDRGTPVDRVYIDAFLTAHADQIRGAGAEVKDDTYLRRYGAGRLTSTAIIDIDPANPHATVHSDLDRPNSLPTGAYDCILLTQTLQVLSNPVTTLRTCHRALRPGGTLLITVPCLARISPSAGPADRWRFTPAGLDRLLTTWRGPRQVLGFGNLRTCLAALLGEAAEELSAAERNHTDPAYPLLAAAATGKT